MPLTASSYSQCKTTWTELSPQEQHQLEYLASLTLAQATGRTSDGLSPTILSDLEKKGITLLAESVWGSQSAEMLRYCRAAELAASAKTSSLSAIELLQDLARSLRFDSERPTSESQDLAALALVHMVNVHGRTDVIHQLVAAEPPNALFWSLYEALLRALPLLDLPVNDGAIFLQSVAKRVQEDLAGSRFYLALANLCQVRPAYAMEIVTHLGTSDGEHVPRLVANLMLGIAAISPEKMAEFVAEAMQSMHSSIGNRCKAALGFMHSLVLAGSLKPEQFLDCADAIMPPTLAAVSYMLAVTVADIGTRFPYLDHRCLETLMVLKKSGPTATVSAGIAAGLAGPNPDPDFTAKCLFLLTDVPIQETGIVGHVASVLHALIGSRDSAVWEFLEHWLTAHDQKASIASHKVFLYTLQYAFRADLTLAVSVLTRWFASPDPRLVRGAREVMRELQIAVFAPNIVRGLGPETTVYVTEKLLAGYMDGPQTVRLCYSILCSTSWVDRLHDYFSTVLRYLTRNYPGAFTEFCAQMSSSKQDRAPADAFFFAAQQQLEAYQAQRQATWTLFGGELAVSQSRTRSYWDLERKKMRLAAQAARDDDRFVFQKLLRHVSIGRGNRSFFMHDFEPEPSRRRTFSEPTPFGEFTQTLELPRGEIVDPEGEAKQRLVRHDLQPDQIHLDRN